MNRKNPNATESLLGQMSLQKPSPQLDEKIEAMMRHELEMAEEESSPVTSRRPVTSPRHSATRPRKVDWRYTWAACLAAAIAGVFAGRMISANNNPPDVIDSPNAMATGKSLTSATERTRLNGSEPRIIEEGFEFHDGKPARVYRVEGIPAPGNSNSHVRERIREKIIVPSSEI